MESYKKLLEYQKSKKLFHGSRYDVSRLKPHAARDVDRARTFNTDTAIFATPHPAVAVAFACVRTNLIPQREKDVYGSKWGVYHVDGRTELRIPRYFGKSMRTAFADLFM